MPDTRPLAPILTPHLTDDQILELATVLREWAGVDWLDATVDDLREARLHQSLYLAALERDQTERAVTVINTAPDSAAGVVDLAAYRKARR